MAAAERPTRPRTDDPYDGNKKFRFGSGDNEHSFSSMREWRLLSGVPGLGRPLPLHKSHSSPNQEWDSMPLPRASLGPRSPLASPLSSSSGMEDANEYSYAYADSALLHKSPAYLITRGQENIYEEICSKDEGRYAGIPEDLDEIVQSKSRQRSRRARRARRSSNSTLDAWPLINTDSAEVDSGVHLDFGAKKSSTATLDRHTGSSDTSFDSDFDSEPGQIPSNEPGSEKGAKMSSVSRMDTKGLRLGLEKSNKKAHTVSNFGDLATRARAMLEHRSQSFDIGRKKSNNNGSKSLWSRALRFGQQQRRRVLTKLASTHQREEEHNVEWEVGTPNFTKRSTITKLWENS